jgi:ribosomal protein L7/L12
MEKVIFKITTDELDFMLRQVPAFGLLSSTDKTIYTCIMGKLAARQGDMNKKFRFPLAKNNNKFAIIKLVREVMGVGLKKAKDMVDVDTIFSLTEWKMSKEAVESMAKTSSYNGSIVIEWL